MNKNELLKVIPKALQTGEISLDECKTVENTNKTYYFPTQNASGKIDLIKEKTNE